MSLDGGAAAAIFGGDGGGAAGDGGSAGDGGAAAAAAAAGAGDGGAAAAAATAAAAAGGGGGAAAAAAAAGGADGGAAGGGEAAPWWGALNLSDATEGDALSDAAWMRNKGYADPQALLKAHRALESKIGAAITVPKDGDPPEKVAAFRKAIGVPESAEGYEVTLPDGAQLDETLFGSFREAAFAAGVPKEAAGALGKWFIAQQLDANTAIVAQRDAEVQDLFKEWGGAKTENLALCHRAAAKLNLDPNAVADIQKGFGAKRTLELLKTLGAGLAEDALLPGGGRGKLGVTKAEADAELARLEADPEFVKKLAAKDPATVARHERLTAAQAAGLDEQRRLAAAG